MWDKVIHDFGTVNRKTKVNAEFQYLGESKIVEVRASCGCTLTEFDKENNKITAGYETSPVASHLLDRGIKSQRITKNITVVFEKGEKQILSIQGTVEA
jgi:hypothetical protein